MITLLSSSANMITGLLLLASALFISIRIARWKLWHCHTRPDLLVLATGYLWLAIGSAVSGVHLIAGIDLLPALHLITIGALGTLSSSVMLRLAWQRAFRRFPPGWQVSAIAVFVTIAAISRYLAGATPYSQPHLLWLSASCWSLVFTGLFWQLIGLFNASHNRLNAGQFNRI